MNPRIDGALLAAPQLEIEKRGRRVNKRQVTRVASVLTAVLAWYLLTGPLEIVAQMKFPSPGQSWDAFSQIVSTGYAGASLAQHVLHSCKLVLLGFSAAVLLGVPFGMLIGISKRAEALFNPIFLLIRPIPPLAWIPLAIVWLGLGDAAKIMVIWMAAFVPAVINSHAGVRAIEPYLIEAGQMLGVSRIAFVREVLLPASLPMLFTGLRLSLQASWTTLVAGELIGAMAGLGQVLTQASLDIYPAMILVAMITVALCGGLMTMVLALIESKVMPWRKKA